MVDELGTPLSAAHFLKNPLPSGGDHIRARLSDLTKEAFVQQ